MQLIWEKVESLRGKVLVLRPDRLPIDIIGFADLGLKLDFIPFDELYNKYGVDAAISADFSALYVDAQQHWEMERGPEWKLRRLRFSIAHEVAHLFLHRDIPQSGNFDSVHDFAQWTDSYGGQKYSIEQEANEFAGRLLVPLERLQVELNL